MDMEEMDIRDDMLRPECWRRAVCPICGHEYLHLVQYKPETCQTIDCIYELRRRNGITVTPWKTTDNIKKEDQK